MSGIWAWLSCVLHFKVSDKLKWSHWPGLGSHLKVRLGKDPRPSLCDHKLGTQTLISDSVAPRYKQGANQGTAESITYCTLPSLNLWPQPCLLISALPSDCLVLQESEWPSIWQALFETRWAVKADFTHWEWLSKTEFHSRLCLEAPLQVVPPPLVVHPPKVVPGSLKVSSLTDQTCLLAAFTSESLGHFNYPCDRLSAICPIFCPWPTPHTVEMD